MKTTNQCRAGLLASAWLFVVSAGMAQSFYLAQKSQNFVQMSASGAVPDPNGPFSFSAQLATFGTFASPTGAVLTLTAVPGDEDFEFNQSFTSKADLDLALPNGTYRLTGTGTSLPALSFNLGTDTYPATTPQVTNGTWSSGGLLIVNPAQATTINFSAFSDYATAGAFGHFDFQIQSFSATSGSKQQLAVATQGVLGLTQASTAPTSFTIPAGTLTAGTVYGAGLNYDLGLTLDTTSVPNGGVVSLFSKKLVFYIVAQAAGTTLPAAPVITLQPIDRTGVVGGSATLSFSATTGSANQTVIWWKDGQQIDFSDQSKYTGFFSTNGSSLAINTLTAADAGNYYAQVIAAGGVATTVTAKLTVASGGPPTVTVQQSSTAAASGGGASFTAAVTSGSLVNPAYQWRLNGTAIPNALSATLQLANVGPADAGIYTAIGTATGGSTLVSVPFGISSSTKVIGAGSEVGADITAPNKNIYDQILLSGAAATITADPGQVTRTSFIDLTNDIVQVEFSGAGSLSLVLDSPSAPAAPINYNQPTVSYMKGHVGLVITGANETTNVSIFSVGRVTAFDPTGAFNVLLPISATNNPANNGSSLFQGHATTNYDGMADVAFIAITSTNGKFGGLRASNASFYATKGLTGVYAPGVQFTGPVFVGDINASDAATPVLVIGSGSDTRITGGDLLQTNGQTVRVSGLTQLKFTDGATSHNGTLPAQQNKAHLDQNGVDVTVKVVSNPP